MKIIPTLLLCCLVTACGTRAPLATSAVSAQQLAQNVVPGRSTRAQVLAALGPTTSLSFDSGYEVWLYRGAGNAAGQTEYVILFDRDGIVSKTRTRAPDGTPSP